MAKNNGLAVNETNQSVEEVVLGSGTIDDILSTLDVDDEIIEAAPSGPELNELELEEAVSSVQVDELLSTAYETSDAQPAASAKDTPKKPAKEKAAKADKEPKAPRVFFTKQSERVAHQLGAKGSEMLLLEINDAMLTGPDLAEKNKEVLALLDSDGTAKKVGEKAAMLFKFMNNGGTLNEVMARAFKVLVRDGELTSGEKGNLQLDLVAKPYSLGTARSQANQIFMLFPILKITHKVKGRMEPNPNSLILAKVKSQLGL